MAYATINKPSDHFNTVLYSGTGSSQGITGVGFQPDWVWVKRRDSAGSHGLHDSNRGSTKRLKSDTTDAEDTNSNILTSFDSDGFTIGDGSGNYNASGGTYASWNWLVNGGTTSSNTDGSITSTVQANTTAGFSIVTYTGNGTNGSSIGHGLNQAPEFIIVKRRDGTSNWLVENVNSLGMYLNLTDGATTSANVMDFSSSSIITFDTSNDTNRRVNFNAETYVAYCFAEIKGYSKFGSYTGNGSVDGPFVYTGFRPAFTLIKRTDATQAWVLHDSARAGYINPTDNYSYANATNVEAEDIDLDYLSNGFKIRDLYNDCNASGGTYIYMAFAENPLVGTNGIPATAR